MDNLPTRKNNITVAYDIRSSLVAARIPPRPMEQRKQLRRLPHVFSRVLELPFNSDVAVTVKENEECFRFVVSTDVVFEDVSVEVLKIVPGITKVVVGGAKRLRISLHDLELDLLRFRLSSSTIPELSTAVYSDGELVITVPKDMNRSFQEEQDNGGLIRVREGGMDAGNRDSNEMDRRFDLPNEETCGNAKTEEEFLCERGTRFSHGTSLMIPGTSVGCLVTV